MPSTISLVMLCVAAFFLGAIPFGFIAGKMQGKDLRKLGSGNIGATNTLRVLGAPAGITVLLLDAAKGLLPVLATRSLFHGVGDEWRVGVGLAAILGHIYSPFVRFKGGKGVATALGVLIALHPLVALITFAVFFVTVAISKYVSLGSILGAITEASAFWLLPGTSLPLRIFGTIVAVFVIIRHRTNITKILAGTENKFGSKKSSSSSEEEEDEKAEG